MLTAFLAPKATVLLLQQKQRTKLKIGHKLFDIAKPKITLDFEHREN